MPRKKNEETVEETNATEATETPAEETAAVETQGAETEATESKPKKSKKASTEEPSIIESVVDTVSSAVETVTETVSGAAQTVAKAVGLSSDKPASSGSSKRAERVGTVTSDKMTKTVVVRVDRLVKHPKYRKYVRRKKNFMAHDELGASIGDKVRIIETRPLSARKRWRVVEIIQRAAK